MSFTPVQSVRGFYTFDRPIKTMEPNYLEVTMNGHTFKKKDCQLLIALTIYIKMEHGGALSDADKAQIMLWARGIQGKLNITGLFDCIVGTKNPIERSWLLDVVNNEKFWADKALEAVNDYDGMNTISSPKVKPLSRSVSQYFPAQFPVEEDSAEEEGDEGKGKGVEGQGVPEALLALSLASESTVGGEAHLEGTGVEDDEEQEEGKDEEATKAEGEHA